FLLLASGCGDDGTMGDQDAAVGPMKDAAGMMPDLVPIGMPSPYGLDKRPSNPSCVAPARPMDVAPGFMLKRVFPNLNFNLPTKMVKAPNDPAHWYLVQKSGQVIVFPNVDNTMMKSTFIDIHTEVNSGPNEAGLLGMAFHPKFAQNNQFFLSYSHPSQS